VTVSLAVTLAVRVYLFQSILSQRVLASAGKCVSVESVGLGISNFSMNSVRMTNLSFSSEGVAGVKVRDVELDYDFWESMRNEGKFEYIIIRKPVITVESVKKLAESLFSMNLSENVNVFGKGAAFLPAVNLSDGVLELKNPGVVFEDVRCNFSPLTDMNLYVRTTARLRGSNTRMTLNWSVNFSDYSLRFGGSISCARLQSVEKILIKLIGSDILNSLSGETDLKFNGKYSYSTGAFEVSCNAMPQNCIMSFNSGVTGKETVLLKTGEVGLWFLGDAAAGIRDYRFDFTGVEAFARNKPLTLSGTLGVNGRKIVADVPSISIYDIEPLIGFGIAETVKKAIPGASLSIVAQNSGITASAEFSPAEYSLYPGVLEVSLKSCRIIVKTDSGLSYPSVSAVASIAFNGRPPLELSASASSPSEMSFSVKGIGTGKIGKSVPDGRVLFSFEEKGDKNNGRFRLNASISPDCPGKFEIKSSGVSPERIAQYLSGQKKTALSGFLRHNAGVFDYSVSGYSENDRIIGSYTVSKGQAPGAAGTFWVKNLSGPLEYSVRSVAEAGWLSSVVDARVSKFLSYFRAADGSKIETVFSGGASSAHTAECSSSFGKASLKGGMVEFEFRPSSYANVCGSYSLESGTLEARLRLNSSAVPGACGKFLAWLGVSEFDLRSAGGGWLDVSSSGSKNGSGAGFLVRIDDPDGARARAIIEKGRIETRFFSAFFSAKINLADYSFSSSGRLDPGIFKIFLPSLAGFSDASVSFSSSSGQAVQPGKAGITVKFGKNDFILKGVSLDADFVVFPEDDGGASFALKKLTIAAQGNSKPLFAMSGDSVFDRKGFPVSTEIKYSFVNDGITFYNLIKDNRLPEIFSFKDPEGLKKLGSFSCSGKLSAKGIVVTSHEFELSASRGGFSFSGSFKQAGSPLNYNSELFNYRAGGTTYKSSCNLDLSGGYPRFRVANDGMRLADLFELIFDEKTGFAGYVDYGADISFEKNSLKISSDVVVRDSKIDIDRLMKILDKRRKLDFENHLDVKVLFSGTNYISTKSLQAVVDGSLSVSGPASAPAVSGKLEILRGRIHYFNRPFNITSGYFSLSSMRNVASRVPVNYRPAGVSGGQSASSSPLAVNKAGEGSVTSFKYTISSDQVDTPGSMEAGAARAIVDVYTNVSATDKINEYDIYLNLYGNKDRLNSVLTSKPELSQDSIYMLLYGMSPNSSPVAYSSRFDDQITSGRVIDAINNQFQDAIYEKIGSSLEKKFNLDEVRINPYTGVNKPLFGRKSDSESKNSLSNMNSFSDLQIKIGKYVDPTLFLSYIKSLNYSRNDSIGMEYKVKDQFFVDGKVDQNLEYTVGAKYGISF